MVVDQYKTGFRRGLAIGITSVLLVWVFSALAAAAEPIQFDTVPVPAQVVGWALEDLAKLPASERPFQRYLWFPPHADSKWPPTFSFIVNTSVNQSSAVQLPVLLANGWLQRWDLRKLAPKESDFQRVRKTWDNLAINEPYFHVPSFNSQVNIAITAPHVGADAIAKLAELSVSTGAIYRADWFAAQVLEAKSYYAFQGWTGKNQRDVFVSLGINEETTKKINGDQRIGLIESQVTGKPRRVDRIQSAGGRNNTGACYITRDIFDEDVNAKNHPLYNLLAFQDRGREVIAERPSGFLAYFIAEGFTSANNDNDGTLVGIAPGNLVADHLIPAPFTRPLQPPISCIRCHGGDGGFKTARNQVLELLQSGIDVFDDASRRSGLTREEVIDRLNAYTGDFSRRIRISRDDYSAAVFRATGGMSVPEVSTKTSEIYAFYRYTKVTPEQAALELGMKIDGQTGAQALRQSLKRYKPDIDGLQLEDPTVGFLILGSPVRRIDFERVYADLMARTKRK